MLWSRNHVRRWSSMCVVVLKRIEAVSWQQGAEFAGCPDPEDLEFSCGRQMVVVAEHVR